MRSAEKEHMVMELSRWHGGCSFSKIPRRAAQRRCICVRPEGGEEASYAGAGTESWQREQQAQ